MNCTVLLISSLVIFVLVTSAFIMGDALKEWYSQIQKVVTKNSDYFFILLVNGVLVFYFYPGFSKYRGMLIGGPS